MAIKNHVKKFKDGAAILNLHEPIENKLFLDRTRKDSNFKRPHIYATLFQIEKCWFYPDFRMRGDRRSPVIMAGATHEEEEGGGGEAPARKKFSGKKLVL